MFSPLLQSKLNVSFRTISVIIINRSYLRKFTSNSLLKAFFANLRRLHVKFNLNAKSTEVSCINFPNQIVNALSIYLPH
ncbi:MAG: hypothetical protein ACTS6G_03680 [Candidatus Hodgkinia cicadicola]